MLNYLTLFGNVEDLHDGANIILDITLLESNFISKSVFYKFD